MKTRVKLLCSSLLLSLIITASVTVGAESAPRLLDKTKKLFEQIQDIELMRHNLEECYQAETRSPMPASWSGQSWRDHAQLDRGLMDRVFAHLAGTPEFERFITEYRTLIQRPDYKRLHTDELFVEYMRMLESGRIRFLTQLKELQGSLAKDNSDIAGDGSEQFKPVSIVAFGHEDVMHRTESGRAVPAVRILVMMRTSGSSPLDVGREGVSRIVVHGTGDQSGSAGTVAPTIDMVDLIPSLHGNESCLRQKLPWAVKAAWSMGLAR